MSQLKIYYIIKYWETMGVVKVKGELDGIYVLVKTKYTSNFFTYGKEAFSSISEAKRELLLKRDRRVDSLKKKIEKLSEMNSSNIRIEDGF